MKRFRPPAQLLLAGLLVAVAAALLYAPGRDYPFESDDVGYLDHNPAVRTLDLRQVLFTGMVPTRPLLQLSLALNYHFQQMQVRGYHLVNISLHALYALLAMLLAGLIYRRLGLGSATWPAALAGLLTAVHPVMLESVALVGTRDNIQAGIFMILCLLAFLRSQGISVRQDHPLPKALPRSLWIFGSIALGALAVLSKENAVVLPALVVLLDYFLKDRSSAGFRFRIGIFALYFAALFGLEITLLSLVHYPHPMIIGYKVIPLAHFLYTQLWVLPVYFFLIAYPLQLTLEPMVQFQNSFLALRPLLGAFLLLALTALALIKARKKNPWALAWLWFIISISATSSLVPFVEYMAVRYLYVPALGFFIAFAAGLGAGSGRRPRIMAGLAAILVPVFLAGLSYHRLVSFRSPTALYRDLIRKDPELSRPYEMLADRLFAEGRVTEAVPYAERALAAPRQQFLKHRVRALLDELYQAFNPLQGNPVTEKNLEQLAERHPRAFLPLAQGYLALGNREIARQYFGASIRSRRQNNPLAYLGLSLILEENGDLESAVQWLRLGREESPNLDPMTRDTLRLRWRELEQKAGIPDLAKTAPLPTETQAQLAKVWQLQAQGDSAAGLDLLAQAEPAAPEHPVPAYLRGVILRRMGRSGEAVAAFARAADRDPLYAPAWNEWAMALLDRQETAAAEKVLLEAIARGVKDPFFYFNLGTLQAQSGRFPTALATYESGLLSYPDHPLLQSGAETIKGYLKEFY